MEVEKTSSGVLQRVRKESANWGRSDLTLKVNEIFYSIQGESSCAGWPCIFIRLTGCNLRCFYCDTAYAYEEGEEKTVFAILEEIQKFQCALVEVTGGEPLLQAETPVLVNSLLKQGYRVILETNGSLDIRRVSNQCVRIVDFKCPGSGMADANNLKNLDYLSDQDEVKFVIGNREDFNYARDLIERMGERVKNSIHFSPVFGKLEPRQLAKWILEENVSVHLQLQIHKIIWPTIKRGI